MRLEYDSDSSCVAKRSKMHLTLADFLNGKLESLTRRDLASYLLPQVAFIPPEDVQIADSGATAFNPGHLCSVTGTTFNYGRE